MKEHSSGRRSPCRSSRGWRAGAPPMWRLAGSIALGTLAWLALGCATGATPAPAERAQPAASAPTGAAGGAGAAAPTAPAAAERLPAQPTTVRAGATWASFTQMPFFYAEEKGYFREQGLEVEREPIGTSDRMIPPLATGQLDVGASGFGAGLYNAVARNISFKIVADNGQSVGTSSGALVVRQDLLDGGQVRDYADLRGRRVALASRGTGIHITLARALEKGRLGAGDVEFVELPFADVSAALANRALDAALHVEPFVAMGVDQGTFGVLKWMDEIYPDQQFNAILYSPQFAANADAGGRFMLAYLRGVRDYNEVIHKGRNVEEFATIGSKYLPIRDPSLYPKMRHIGMNPDGYLNRPGMEDDLNWYVAQGLVRDPPDLDTLVDYTFVEAALAKLGRYR